MGSLGMKAVVLGGSFVTEGEGGQVMGNAVGENEKEMKPW